ncbi:unnamed protein product [Effrenium voratum]|uniref:Uncharacterized protein n=1 Tax=Effrenium voratum TaxID=2562239 RepID=A0AA36IAR4_9DINO|nr:unnamed protein product [Effrenium voratum]
MAAGLAAFLPVRPSFIRPETCVKDCGQEVGQLSPATTSRTVEIVKEPQAEPAPAWHDGAATAEFRGLRELSLRGHKVTSSDEIAAELADQMQLAEQELVDLTWQAECEECRHSQEVEECSPGLPRSEGRRGGGTRPSSGVTNLGG